jgi:uncharacterized protein (DUF4415 family)
MNDKPCIVRYVLEPPTEERRAALKALAKPPDDQIDTSDIPPLDDDFFKNALRNPWLYPPVRLDANVVEWFQQQVGENRSIMTAVNQVLKDHVRAERNTTAGHLP